LITQMNAQPNLTAPSYVARILAEHGLHLKKGLGQNFLVDRNTLDKIVAAAELTPNDLVFEIGAGIGTLTRELAAAAKRVISVEIDPGMLAVLKETTGDLSNLRIVQADVLKLDIPSLLAQEVLATKQGTAESQNFLEERDIKVKVVANLPYCITTPVLTKLIEMHAASRYGACPKLDAIVLLVQKEVAQRLAAEPGTHPYGALSVLVQFWCSVEIISVVSRRVFLPRPKVDSAIVRLRPRGSPAVPVSDEQFFFKVVRAAFGQRRKTLLNALQSLPGVRLGRTQLEQAILDAGINPQQRGETLSIQQFANLADSIAKRTAQNE